MTDKQYFDAILRGHFRYWEMLGNLRGNQNHQEDNLRWLTGDINHTYFTGKIEKEPLIQRMKDGEIPDNL
ncbi:MAG: hypothetical protein LBN04_00240 [Oscillospiraceae bacterium]|jgi:hypothetical protein|nr:hypothetical protein [Oscillospiraceae bacterium]